MNNKNINKNGPTLPQYRPFDCRKCGIWGHSYTECDEMSQLPDLRKKYADYKPNSMINTAQSKQKKDNQFYDDE